MTTPVIEDEETEVGCLRVYAFQFWQPGQVWVIPQTSEIFTDYEAYLSR